MSITKEKYDLLDKKYDDLLNKYVDLEVRFDLLEKKWKKCELICTQLQEDIKQLKEMNKNQQKEILLLKQQVNDLMGLGKKKK